MHVKVDDKGKKVKLTVFNYLKLVGFAKTGQNRKQRLFNTKAIRKKTKLIKEINRQNRQNRLRRQS